MKGEISINILMAIVVAAVGILILMTIILTQTSGVDKIYCLTIDSVRTSLLRLDPNPKCVEKLLIEEKEETITLEQLNTFLGNQNMHELTFSANNTYKILFEIPKDVDIDSASVIVASKDKSITVDKFEKLDETQIQYLSSSTDNKTFYLNISKNIEIDDATFTLEYVEIPPKADIYFVIDNSGSMQNEWLAICNTIQEVKDELENNQIDGKVTVLIPQLPDDTGINLSACPQISNIETLPNWLSIRKVTGLTYFQNIPDPIYKECGDNPPKNRDDLGEAWATASAYLAGNASKWRNNSKRIIFPISDSDPTGADLKVCEKNGYQMAYFSGNEELHVNKSIELANKNNVKIFPVYGDLDLEGSPEGFMVGCDAVPGNDISCCYKDYEMFCKPILDWMDKIARETGGQMLGFKDRNKLKNFIFKAVNIAQLKNIKIKVGSTTLNPIGDDFFTDKNSPQIVDMKEILTRELSTCSTDFCNIPIIITSDTEGSFEINNISISFVPKIPKISVSIDNENIYLEEDTVLKKEVDPIDMTQEVTDYYKNICNKKDCKIPLLVSIDSPYFPSIYQIRNLSIKYEESDFKKQLLNEILKCWDKSNRGRSNNDFICAQLRPTRLSEPITEKLITEMLVDRKVCHIIENGDISLFAGVSCGNDDNLEVDEIIQAREVLVEYKDKKVVVS